jgi:hypothetical protein
MKESPGETQPEEEEKEERNRSYDISNFRNVFSAT